MDKAESTSSEKVKFDRENFSLKKVELLRTVGTGTFGRVMAVREKETNKYFALKILVIDDVIRMKQVEHVKNEKHILEMVNHPFIVDLYWTRHDIKFLYMLMEYICGGELFTYLRNQSKFDNATTLFFTSEIVSALGYLHSLQIVYRDLKPENLLLDEHGHVKITDFGFAKVLRDRTYTMCGTPEYLAPEIIQGKGYNKAVDWWAMGVLIYEMLVGADQLEQQLKEKEEEKRKKEEEMQEVQKKLQQISCDCDMAQEALQVAIAKLESTEKRASETETEVQSLTRRSRLIEEDLEQTETRLQEATVKLDEATKAADESERSRNVLETRSIADGERIAVLEEQLKEAKYIALDSDRKFDETARKLAITEVDLERAEYRLHAAENKSMGLEDELTVVGNIMKSLEISEQEAAQKEDIYEASVRDLSSRLKIADQRATDAERQVAKLQSEVDRLEDELVAEKEKYKLLSSELDSAFAELTGY